MFWREVKDETSFRHTHAEIQTRVIVIGGPLDHGGADISIRSRVFNAMYYIFIEKVI